MLFNDDIFILPPDDRFEGISLSDINGQNYRTVNYVSIDDIILIIEKIFNQTLVNNPYPVNPNNVGEYDYTGKKLIIRPWEYHQFNDTIARDDYLKEIYNFTISNCDSFKLLDGYQFILIEHESDKTQISGQKLTREYLKEHALIYAENETIWEKYSHLYNK